MVPTSSHADVLQKAEAGARIARQRGQVYRFLGTLYLNAQEPHVVAVARRAPIRNRLGRLMGNAASEHLVTSHLVGSHVATLLDQLQTEHAALFGAHSHQPVLLLETAYCLASHLGLQRTEELPHIYREAGFEYERHQAHADHVGVELLFIAHLCGTEWRAWRQGLTHVAHRWSAAQERFLRGHLASWVEWLRTAINRSDEACWFRVIAATTDAFIIADLQRLQALARTS